MVREIHIDAIMRRAHLIELRLSGGGERPDHGEIAAKLLVAHEEAAAREKRKLNVNMTGVARISRGGKLVKLRYSESGFPATMLP